MNVDLEEDERQAIILAMACLSIQRPGWETYLHEIAEKLQGRMMFLEFKVMNSPTPVAVIG